MLRFSSPVPEAALLSAAEFGHFVVTIAILPGAVHGLG
jgi:hypothetical protein